MTLDEAIQKGLIKPHPTTPIEWDLPVAQALKEMAAAPGPLLVCHPERHGEVIGIVKSFDLL